MTNQFGIPEDELKQFQPFLHVYPAGTTIIHEGEISDQRIYLLRKGEVGVYRMVGEKQESIGKIEAVNFFGEMAIVSQRPRTASVVAASESIIVYEFTNPNLSVIMANPTWGLMLLRRLADNLADRHVAYETAQMQVIHTKNEIGALVGLLVTLYITARKDKDATELFNLALPKLLAYEMENLDMHIIWPDRSELQKLFRQGQIPEELYRLALVTRSKIKDGIDAM